MMRRILITGGAGNVGGSLARRLAVNSENHITIVDNLLTGNRNKLPSTSHENWQFIRADINDYSEISAIMMTRPFDYVFHYAAVVGVARTIANPKLVLDDIDGLKNVLNLSKNTQVKRVFFSSSSEVYGEPVEYPQNEESTPLNSRLPYAIIKNLGETFCKSYYQEYGLPFTIFRFFNTFGPLQSEDFVVARFLRLALNDDPITINGDGMQTRTFCFIADNLDVTEQILYSGEAENSILNVGSDEEVTIIELARLIISITGSKSKIVHLPPLKEGDMSRRRPDISKMRKILGRDPMPLREGILNMIELMGGLERMKKQVQ